MPDESIDVPGFNVLRVSAGPWFTVFNPGRLTVGDPITFGLDGRLFGPHPLPASGTLIDAGMLRLEVRPGYPSCHAVLAGGVWTFARPGCRPALLAAFEEFGQRAEKLEGSVLRPGATEALRALLAPRIPATYAESLYLRHGVFSQDNPARGYFDAQPGMRLALQFEERQFVPPNAGTGLLSGFVGGAAVTADVVSFGSSSGAPRLGLDAFFAAVRLPPVPPAAGGAGGIIDLAGATAGARHLRVCYPATSFPGADGGGTVGAAGNVALLGAADLATLAAATDSYYGSGDAGANLVGWFRGRTVIRARIPVLVDGTRLCHVPVGTTARALLEQFGVLPRLPRIVDGDGSAALNYRRHLPGLGVTELYGPDSYHKLTLAGGDGPDSSGADALDFPVLAGDALSLPGPGREP